MLFAVSYDVRENTSRAKLAKRLLDLGERVQKSVFECELEPEAFRNILPSLISLIDTETDSIRIYELGQCCAGRTTHEGVRLPPRATEPGEDGLIVI